MKIGFSIESPALKEDDYTLLANHNNLEQLLTELKSRGVNSIEIRKLSRGIDDETYKSINKSIQMIWDKGMQITIHGDVEGDFDGETFSDIYPSMKYILDNFKQYQNEIVIPIHAIQKKADETSLSWKKLKSQTIDLFKKWTKMIEAENLPIYFALENNRSKETAIDPGNSCKEVLEMVEAIDSPHLGICWDMGHLYSNLTVGREIDMNIEQSNVPPKEFLKKVIHTHIHSLNSTGKTHFPLTKEFIIPLESYVEALKNVDYEKTLNMELSFDRYGKNSPVREMIYSSINRLVELKQ